MAPYSKFCFFFCFFLPTKPRLPLLALLVECTSRTDALRTGELVQRRPAHRRLVLPTLQGGEREKIVNYLLTCTAEKCPEFIH